MNIFYFREFRNAFFEILHYNNCKCLPCLSGSKVRTSISKSSHSMNTKMTPPILSRQTSIIPYSNQFQRNGCISYETSSSICTPIQKKTSDESIDTYEMQTLLNQRKTAEAFNELEHLVPNGVPSRASLAHMNSIIQEQDENIVVEIPINNKSTLRLHSNHS
jgi:hypothetical protein